MSCSTFASTLKVTTRDKLRNLQKNFISTEFLEFSHKYHRDWNVGSGFSSGIFPEEKKNRPVLRTFIKS